MNKRRTALQREWRRLERQEMLYLEKRREKKDSKLNQLLESKVPEGLQSTLDVAFSKAFYLVFEKGTGIIEKTYQRDELKNTYQINEFAAQVRGNRKSLRAFSRKATGAGYLNLLISGASGIGMGVLGIGLPDIVLFTGMMLKSVYEIALNYGFDYQEEEEKRFILLIIQGALAYGEELRQVNDEVNHYIGKGIFFADESVDISIKKAASYLSKELLYMKFLQGIPVVGAVGGAYDAIYMKHIVQYAEMKYRRRFYERKL